MEGNMGIKRTVLVKSYHLVEVEEEELCKEDGILDELIREISNDKEEDILGEKVLMHWQGTAVTPLLPELNNCGKCSCCGAWTTDREKEEPIEGLANGAVHEGRLLCEGCLPEDHKWAF
jgi:hypothetical protein